MQGVNEECLEAVMRGDLSTAQLGDKERRLLEFAETLTRTPDRVSPGLIETVRDAGWSDLQIAESVYVIAMFAFFNRVANAFGLEDPSYGNEGPPVREES